MYLRHPVCYGVGGVWTILRKKLDEHQIRSCIIVKPLATATESDVTLAAYQRTRVPREELLKDVRIVARCNDRRRLIMTEAIIIKEERPALISQTEDAIGYLK